MMNILITSVGRRSYIVDYFKKALNGRGKVFVGNSTKITPSFLHADHAVVTPLIYDEDYVSFLLKYCEQNEISIIISLFDIDLPVLAKNKNKFLEKGITVIVSDSEIIDICNDKFKSFLFLSKNGFFVPKTYLTIDDFNSALLNSEVNFPVIIKPRWGMGSIGIYQADDYEELNVLYRKVKKEIFKTYLAFESEQDINSAVLIQQKLKGQEYGLDIINNLKGKYITTVVKEKFAMRAGETDCAKTVACSRLSELGMKLGSALKHIANLDVDAFFHNNEYYILEMNARFGGGYPFSHIAGVNLVRAIIEWTEGNYNYTENLAPTIGIVSMKDIVLQKLSDIE